MIVNKHPHKYLNQEMFVFFAISLGIDISVWEYIEKWFILHLNKYLHTIGYIKHICICKVGRKMYIKLMQSLSTYLISEHLFIILHIHADIHYNFIDEFLRLLLSHSLKNTHVIYVIDKFAHINICRTLLDFTICHIFVTNSQLQMLCHLPNSTNAWHLCVCKTFSFCIW